MSNNLRLLIINPGSTSTKVAVFKERSCLWRQNVSHPAEEIGAFGDILEEAEYRYRAVLKALAERVENVRSFDAVVARGGLLKPLPAGVYAVGEEMYRDLASCRYGRHASNTGGIIAYRLHREAGIPALVVDPVSVDEFTELARYSGLSGIERQSQLHALNMRAAARKVASLLGRSPREVNLVIAHLGSGISVAPYQNGRLVDVNNANNEGPFSLERCGTLPSLALIDLCYSGRYTREEMISLVTRRGGIYSYLGTKDFRKVEEMIARGNREALQVVMAMCYQVAKEIGAMATVLCGRVDGIVLTGGLACSRLVVEEITPRVSFIAPVTVIPGEEEMEALALGALAALRGEEKIKNYAALE